ncbi:MAG: ABC transporter substrate-binding protein [bacterium]|nr:ABC transporter substrate-binding protein [bacterium]
MKRVMFHLCIVVISLVLLPFNSFAEWSTNDDFPPIGDPNAKKGGSLRRAIISYPATFRQHGPSSGTVFISLMSSLVYQRLIGIHPNTLEFIPDLADAWEIQEDNKTFLFRINPKARWEDGQPVTPEDVVFSYELIVDPETKDPYSADLFSRLFEKPEIVDEHTVKFVAKTLHWRNFLFCGANLPILPAHTFRGKNYLKDFNWKIPNGSGPYTLEKFKKGSNIIFKRRDDFWGKDERGNTGLYNFDRIKFSVVRDRNLIFEKFKKGEFDYYVVGVARKWVEEMNFDKIQHGWIQKRKVFTFEPNGVSGLALNMRQAPFDDVRIRKTMAYLYNRPLFMDKLFFNEYVNTYSYFPGSIYENPTNERVNYDPEKAQALLEEAGWKERNSQGILEKDGKPFIVTALYGDKTSERHLTIYQEDLKKAGIELKLKLVDYSTMYKLIDERNFHMANMAWNALIFPNPESGYHSKYADIDQTNNITGIKHPRIDEILEQYPEMFEVEQRVNALQELDGLVYQEHPYVLNWYGPFTRVLYWNRFEMPESYFSKFGDSDDILSMWWYDEEKVQQLKETMKKGTPLKAGKVEVHYWTEQE